MPVAVYGCVWMCCVCRYSALRRVMRAGGGIRCLTGRHACAGALRRGRGDRACAKRDCGGAVCAKTNKKAPPPPKRGEAKLAVPPLFCTGIPLMQISLRLNAARRLRLVSAHRTGGPGAPHRGAWRGGRGQQSGSGGNFVGRRRRACSQPVTRVLWCTAGGTTFSVMAFGQYLQKIQKAIGVF